MKKNDLQTVARVLCANEMSKSKSHFFGRRKTVLAIQDHRVRTVEHDDCRTRRAVILLMNVQVLVLEIEGHVQACAGDRREQRCVDVKIYRVAKLVLLGRKRG